MSEPSAASFRASHTPSAGFRSDPRFGTAVGSQAAPAEEIPDPRSLAWTEGFSAGAEQARMEAADAALTDANALDALTLSFKRLDRELAETLRQRLRDTVAALCEAALAPMALNEQALLARIGRAVEMFARADDERVIRLHPDDLALVSPCLATDWQVMPDPSLARGALRVESATGGVEDGPAEWRRAIAEALHQC